MLRPAYKLTIGRKVVDTTDEPKASTVVDLNVALDIDTPADSFTLVFGNVGTFKPAREDETKIELGYADNGGFKQVVVGKVSIVEPDLTTTRVTGFSAADALLRTFVNQTYEDKTAGAIVRDLANQAGVAVAGADDGISFPAYVIDGRRSVYRHLYDLAAFCGFDVYLNSDGKLVFEKFLNGKTVHLFDFAKNIVALDVERTPPLAGLVETWGEGVAANRGEDAWAWVTTDFRGSSGSAGTGALLLREQPALRTKEAARTAANAALKNIQRRTVRGQLQTIGRPEIKLGDAIRLRGMTDDALNTTFQVRSVLHRITKIGGFTTTVGFRAIQTS
jgi:phage protein D